MTATTFDIQMLSTPVILKCRPSIVCLRILVRDIVLLYEYQGIGPEETTSKCDLTFAKGFTSLAYLPYQFGYSSGRLER